MSIGGQSNGIPLRQIVQVGGNVSSAGPVQGGAATDAATSARRSANEAEQAAAIAKTSAASAQQAQILAGAAEQATEAAAGQALTAAEQAALDAQAASEAAEQATTVLVEAVKYPELAATDGAGRVGFNNSQFAGSVARTVQERLEDTIHAADFGVVADNATDNSDSIEAAILACKARRSAALVLPGGEIRHSRPIVVDESSIFLSGSGTNMTHDAGTGISPGTILIYTGGDTDAQVIFTSPVGSDAQKKSHGGLDNVWMFNLSGGAKRALLVRSYNGGNFENLWAVGHPQVCYQIDINAGPMAEAKDSQRNRFINCQGEPTAGGGIWYLEGGIGANASFNYFLQCGGRHRNGRGWTLGNSDNNIFVQCGAFRVPGGTGLALEFRGANPGEAHARSNHFLNFSCNGGITARGTTSYAVPSDRNSVMLLDQDNSAPLPTIEPGAQLYYTTDDGVSFGAASARPTFAEGLAGAKAQRALRGTETIRVHNLSQNHVVLTDGSASWTIRIAASGALELNRTAGNGTLQLGGDVSLGAWSGASDQSIVGYLTVKDSAGNLRKLATIA